MAASQRTEEEIFHAMIAKPASERSVYLRAACGDDSDLLAHMDALLQAYETKDGILADSFIDEGITLDHSQPMESPGTIIDRYKLLEKIGEGGFGVVWAAQQQEPVKRRVALKIIKLGMDTRQVVARFEAERQALALMDHPNIAKVLDGGSTEAGRPYFVMELVRGIPIIEYCDQERLSTRERLDLFIKICHAIQHAHQKGIIHRDIKPSNILITLHDGVPVPRVIDFGIAKATQQELTEKTIYTQHHQFIGTPVYMSPEQAEMSGLDIDTRSDIYSLGVLLYELLTGMTPFDEKQLLQSGIDEMRKIIREQEPPRPSTKFATLKIADQSTTAMRHATESPKLISLLRGDLDWIAMKCLEKDRARRYDTANGLALDIARHLNDEAVTARPPTVAYRFQKAWRRNKLVYAAAGLVVASLIIGISLSVWQAWEAETARGRESALREEAQEAKGRESALREEAQEGERKQRLIAYASDMRVAQGALAENNLSVARQRLDRYLPEPNEEDLRGIAWRYLWQVTRGDEIHTFPHESMVREISLSADGVYLASTALDGKIRLFDLDSHLPPRVFEGGSKATQEISVALSPEGKFLAAADKNTPANKNTLKVWDVGSYDNAPIQIFKDVKAPVGFSPDSRWLAATTEDGLRIWNTADWTSTPLGTPLKTDYKPSLAFTPDSSRIIFAPDELASKLTVYNLAENTREGELEGLEGPQAISTDGSVVAAGGRGGDVCVWDLASRTLIASLEESVGNFRLWKLP